MMDIICLLTDLWNSLSDMADTQQVGAEDNVHTVSGFMVHHVITFSSICIERNRANRMSINKENSFKELSLTIMKAGKYKICRMD
jgi:hypothetical protein